MAINFTLSVFRALVSDVLFQALVADNIRRYGEFPVPAIERGGNRHVQVWPDVRIKTFSTHVVVVFRLVVSGKRFSAHEETEKLA